MGTGYEIERLPSRTSATVSQWKRNWRTKTASKPSKQLSAWDLQLTYEAERQQTDRLAKRMKQLWWLNKTPPSSCCQLLNCSMLKTVQYQAARLCPLTLLDGTSTCPGAETWRHWKYVLLQCWLIKAPTLKTLPPEHIQNTACRIIQMC